MLNESPLLLPLWEENCWCVSLLLFTFSYLSCILPEVLDLFLKLLTNFQNSQQGLLPQRALHPTHEASFCDPNEADSEKRENLSIDGLSLRGFFFFVLRKKLVLVTASTLGCDGSQKCRGTRPLPFLLPACVKWGVRGLPVICFFWQWLSV